MYVHAWQEGLGLTSVLEESGCGVACWNPSTLWAEGEKAEFAVILGYVVSWKPVWNTQDK